MAKIPKRDYNGNEEQFMNEQVANKIPSEVKSLVAGGIYSLFQVSRAPKAGVYFVLITDKIVDGAPQLFWLNESGSPVDISLKSLADVTLGEKVTFQST